MAYLVGEGFCGGVVARALQREDVGFRARLQVGRQRLAKHRDELVQRAEVDLGDEGGIGRRERRFQMVAQRQVEAQVENLLAARGAPSGAFQGHERLTRAGHAVDDRALLSLKEVEHARLLVDELLVDEVVEVRGGAGGGTQSGNLRREHMGDEPMVVFVVQRRLDAVGQLHLEQTVDRLLYARAYEIVLREDAVARGVRRQVKRVDLRAAHAMEPDGPCHLAARGNVAEPRAALLQGGLVAAPGQQVADGDAFELGLLEGAVVGHRPSARVAPFAAAVGDAASVLRLDAEDSLVAVVHKKINLLLVKHVPRRLVHVEGVEHPVIVVQALPQGLEDHIFAALRIELEHLLWNHVRHLITLPESAARDSSRALRAPRSDPICPVGISAA